MSYIDEKGEYIKLQSGKEINFNNGFVGLNKIGEVSGGYDSVVHCQKMADWCDDAKTDYCLTNAECIELANTMLARWAEFRASHGGSDWILCSERMPSKVGGSYLVTLDNGYVDCFDFYGVRPWTSAVWQQVHFEYEADEVIAWMELPTAYEPRGSES